MDEKKVQAIMNLIIYGGDGKSSSVEAIQAAKEGKFWNWQMKDQGSRRITASGTSYADRDVNTRSKWRFGRSITFDGTWTGSPDDGDDV